jgi:type IV pilus assembly protein PilA
MNQILSRMREKRADDDGFTLIELLVVVVIIGVLVAIAVPVYLNYRQGAADKSAQSDVRGALSAVEQYYTSNGNTYPATAASAANATSLLLAKQTGGTDATITLSDKTSLGYNLVTASTYTICATNSGGSGKWYVYNSAAGGSVKASTVTSPTVTTC